MKPISLPCQWARSHVYFSSSPTYDEFSHDSWPPSDNCPSRNDTPSDAGPYRAES